MPSTPETPITDFPKATLIPVNGVELEVFEAKPQGSVEQKAKPIVLCHGWPELAYSWRYQVPALVAAGYHVIIPNQRGYGNSSRPAAVIDYDIERLSGDLVALLDHFGYETATIMGHDWGAMVVWGLTLLHPNRVDKVINLSLPYQVRGERPWIEVMEEFLGSDFYFVHFNRQPGVADAILDENTGQFLNNLYRKNVPLTAPEPGMQMIKLARAATAPGDPVMNEEDLALYSATFKKTGFTGGVNWYRNLDRNWHILGKVDPIIHQPTLMIHGAHDPVQKLEQLTDFVPNAEVITLDCGHWIQQERPEETNQVILEWLGKQSDI